MVCSTPMGGAHAPDLWQVPARVPSGEQVPRHHPAVAAVVPAAAEDRDRAAPGVAPEGVGDHPPRRGRPRVVVAVGEPLVAREKEPTSSFNDRIEASVRALYAEHRPRIDA